MPAKINILTLLFLLFLSFPALSSIHTDKIGCEKSKLQAQTNLKQKKIMLMLQGGIAPVHVLKQELFEQKYKVTYFDLGCMIPQNFCLEHYNAEVVKYLDKVSGKNWRKQVRKDVVGV